MQAQLPTIDESLNEAAIIERALLDPAAFAPLYTRYAPRIFQYLLTRCATADDAADLMQAVFLRAIEALPTLRRRYPDSFAAWLFRIARNAANDAHRRQRPATPWDHMPESLLVYPGLGPEATIVHRDSLNLLRILIAELSPERQELVALRFAAKLSFAEIAVTLGKRETTVRRQWQRTLHRLQERFDEHGL